jgi:alanine racemase
MIRSTVARVDLDALKNNFDAIQSYLASDPARTPPGIIAVVKANAYGHGSERVALALEQAGATMLACADIEEGIVLRRAGVRVPILVFGALSVSDLDGVFDYALTPTISSPGAARAVQAAADRRRTTMAYHLKIDTGMNRLGFRHDNLGRTLPELLASPNLRLDAVFTHFASADVPESPVFNDQRLHFERALETVDGLVIGPPEGGPYVRMAPEVDVEAASRRPAIGGDGPPEGGPHARTAFESRRRIMRHACNSAALLRDSRVWYDAVRPGLLLYGIVPPPLASTIALKPVMSLTSRVTAVKGLRPGEGVGYGWRFRADAPRTIAVIPAGYADGLDTRLSGRGHVLIRGKRVPIVGAVSMDMITVDVTDVGDVQPGDEVVLLGRQGDESWQQIDAREVAAAIGTIPWEIVCRLGTRIERNYDEGPRPMA